MPARGETNAEIARILWLSPGTVRKNLENVFAKLGIKTRTAAVAAYIGLLDDVEEARRVGGSAD
jgi:DNA-binding CsgD family transcriptional regulator